MEFLGFTFERKVDKAVSKDTSFSSDGILVDEGIDVPVGSNNSTGLDVHVSLSNQAKAINYYRTMSGNADVDFAICEIIDSAITVNSDDECVSINLDKTNLSKSIQKKVSTEFDTVVKLLDFKHNGYEIAKTFYIDGQLNYQKVVNPDKLKEGIKRLSYLDPRGIKKIREIKEDKDESTGVIKSSIAKEYYVYSTDFISKSGTNHHLHQTQTITLEKDSVVHVNSGLINVENNVIRSYLHKAIKPLNNLTHMEDSTVIYRLGRASEKRAFYVGVGTMAKAKAEAYMKSLAAKFNSNLTYDKESGVVQSNSKTTNVAEDYWLPRRNGTDGTEITTIEGASNLSDIEDIQYFQKKLFRSLNVPPSRLESEGAALFGSITEITNDELKFEKFIYRFRTSLSGLMYNLLRDQLVLKNIITIDDWEDIKQDITFKFSDDSYITEQKEDDLIQTRISNLSDASEFVGEYYDKAWVYKNILHFTDEGVKSMKLSDEPDDDDSKESAEQEPKNNKE